MTLSTADLQLHTNDKFKKTLKTSCTVKMSNGVDSFNEFITVGHNPETGKTTMLHNADELTLGQAYLMIATEFKSRMAKLDPAMQKEIMDHLEGAS